MTLALPVGANARTLGRWPTHLLGLALCWAALLLLFRRDAVDMVGIWLTSSTFGHCLMIGPVLAWLVWQRRPELAQLKPVAWAPGLALVAGGGAAWLVGDAATFAFARQFGLLLMMQGAVVTLLGPNVARGLAFPLAYAVFLVPFGEWLEPPLQQVTVRLVMPLLAQAGIPAASDGVMIHAGRYWFEVAEACSGAKFLLSMAAFGVLVANICFTAWRRRLAFLLACLVVPVMANGVRAFGTIWVADRTSVQTAAGFDHIVYGWIFFGVVMAAMLAIGWRWFDRPADAPAFDPQTLRRPVRGRVPLAAGVTSVLLLASLFPSWSHVTAGKAATAPAVHFLRVPGWHLARSHSAARWTAWYPGASRTVQARYVDGAGHAVDLSMAIFTRQEEGRELVGYGIGVLRAGAPWVRVGDDAPLAGGSVVRIIAPGPVERTVATWYRIGGIVTSDPRRVKLETLRARLLGGSQQAVALHLSVERQAKGNPREVIAAFLRAAGQPATLIDRMAGAD
ncbi:exosortase A [Sphingomonas gellani]|uniref:Exosortase A n=1 Tax=Sphingomonas gellani TaxID=1166340 RepID=A0A1H7YB23_9SPHN|nr:exosortase A [Sphingomonas gellani]SEM43392.1 exosortase A [Sphingomonas gellani]